VIEACWVCTCAFKRTSDGISAAAAERISSASVMRHLTPMKLAPVLSELNVDQVVEERERVFEVAEPKPRDLRQAFAAYPLTREESLFFVRGWTEMIGSSDYSN
jgi:hypothetical protein